MQYHEHSDYNYASNLNKHAPGAVQALQELDRQAIHGSDNPIDPMHAELIALGVALTTQCPYCIESHSAAAQKAGATEEEIAQTTMIATALRAGAAFGHGLMALKFFDRAQSPDAG